MSGAVSIDAPAAELGRLVEQQRLQVAVAESLTGGMLTNALSRTEGSGDWLRGGVVAYASEVKYEVLGVRRGPVVSETAARQMAEGVAELMGAQVAVSVTGVGGPEEQEGQPPGTVWMAATAGGRTEVELHRFNGDPSDVCDQSCQAALELAVRLVASTPA